MLLKIYLLFWFFSVLGWIMEVIVCSISDKRLVNRGFLIGPYCPIYGFGALIMLILSPYKDHLFTCFILALVLCSTLEYFTSFLMEKLFSIRWWDYSNDSFNINGRVCLRNAIAFGALGVIFTRYLNPLYFDIIEKLSDQMILVLSIIVFVITVIDILISLKAIVSIKQFVIKDLSKYQKKDATSEIKKLVNKKVLKLNFLQKRLVKTYHLLEKEKDYLKNKIIQVNEKTKSGYGLLLLFIVLGLVIGLILSYVIEISSYKIIIPFTISLSSLIAILIMRAGDRK